MNVTWLSRSNLCSLHEGLKILSPALFWVITQSCSLRNDPEECSAHLFRGRSL